MRKALDWIITQGQKAKVILKAAPTWFTTAAAAVAYFHDNIIQLLPVAWQGDAADLAVSLGASFAAAISLIRRVTPVEKGARGVLPVVAPQPLYPDV